MSEAIEALAEAWASLDGNLEGFHAGRAGEDTEGHYHGYLSDAAELAKRLERRGYVRLGAPGCTSRKPRRGGAEFLTGRDRHPLAQSRIIRSPRRRRLAA